MAAPPAGKISAMTQHLSSRTGRAAAATTAVALAVLLAACGQKGPLYLPQEPAAAHRATLPQALFRPLPAQAAQKTSAPEPKKPAPTADGDQ